MAVTATLAAAMDATAGSLAAEGMSTTAAVGTITTVVVEAVIPEVQATATAAATAEAAIVAEAISKLMISGGF